MVRGLTRVLALASIIGVPLFAESTLRARTLTGRITDARGWAGKAQFSIVVAGTRIGVVTNDSGYFTLANVPDTPVVLVVKHPCYFTTRVEIPENARTPLALGMPFDEASRARAGCGGLGARSEGGANDFL